MPDNPAQYVTYEAEPATYGGSAPRPALNWRDYLYILLERAWIAVSVVALVMTVAVFHANKKVPVFPESARLQMHVPQARTVK